MYVQGYHVAAGSVAYDLRADAIGPDPV